MGNPCFDVRPGGTIRLTRRTPKRCATANPRSRPPRTGSTKRVKYLKEHSATAMARTASRRSLDTETAAIGPRTSRRPRPADVRSGSHRAYTGRPVALRTPSMSCRRSHERRRRAQPGHGPASSVSRRSWPTCSGLRSSPNAASDNRRWRPIVIASSCCIAGAARWPSRNVTSGRSARIESPIRPVAYEPTGPWHRVSGNGRTTSAATRIIVVRHHARSAARHRRTSWT